MAPVAAAEAPTTLTRGRENGKDGHWGEGTERTCFSWVRNMEKWYSGSRGGITVDDKSSIKSGIR